jgi:hypothetical protein
LPGFFCADRQWRDKAHARNHDTARRKLFSHWTLQSA